MAMKTKLACLLIAAGVCWPCQAAQDGQADQLDKILDTPVSMGFEDTPLEDCLEFLRDFTGANVKATQREEFPVNLDVENITMRSALNLMAAQAELSCVREKLSVRLTNAPKTQVLLQESPKQKERKKLLQKALEMSVSCDFADVELKHVCQAIGQFANASVILHDPALRKANVTANKLVTLKGKDIPLKDAFGFVLEPLGLRVVVRDEVFFVTSAKEKGDDSGKKKPKQ
jgi:hypothetical protein